MRFLIVLLFVSGCSPENTPWKLQQRDQAEAECAERCNPRPVEYSKYFFGGIALKCLCVDEKKKE